MFPRRQLLTVTVALALSLPCSGLAAGESPQLLDELRDLVEKSRRERAADRWLQGALEDLLAKYDSPWQREILYEDFRDGDYTSNPGWQVLRGRFQVVRGQGLYSVVEDTATTAPTGGTPQQSPTEALSGLIVGALLDKALGTGPSSEEPTEETATVGGPAEIRLEAGVGNAFAIDLGFRHAANRDAAFELALLQSEAGTYGYRLRLQSGTRPFVELQRIRGGRGAIVETRELGQNYADGQLHELGWRQAPDGTVRVSVDGEVLFSVRDRAFRDPYPWLYLRHDQGELTVRSLRISGI